MQKFRFSLEALLAVRNAKAEQQEQELGQAVATYNRQHQASEENAQRQDSLWSGLREGFHERHCDYLYLMRLQQENQALEQDLHHAHQKLVEEQQEYTERRRDVRALEKLREQQYKVYQKKYRKMQDETMEEARRSIVFARQVQQRSKDKA